MTRVAGSLYPRQLEPKICEAIGAQVSSDSRSGRRGFGKLWTVAKMQNLRVAVETFAPDDPDYNPNDTALIEIHSRVKPAPRPNGSG